MFRKPRPSSSHSGVNGTAATGGGGGDNGGMTTTPRSSHVLIQRLIILHDGLMPLPPSKSQQHQKRVIKHRRNPQLSENASLEEHGEFILYYYDHSLHYSREGSGRQPPPEPVINKKEVLSRRGSDISQYSNEKETPPPADYASEEAVRFAGICRALRSLPQALQLENEHSEENDEGVSETNVVHLKDSTLVFVPLELRGDIVAVAQIVRADNSQTQQQNNQRSHYAGYGADPSAIKQAIQHIHTSFSLLFGGGIHRRLLRTRRVENSSDWVCEVIEDDDKMGGGRRGGLIRKDSGSSKTSLKKNSNWELGEEVVDQKEDFPETRRGSNGSARRKSRKPKKSLKRLSSSHSSMNDRDLSSSFNSEDGSQITEKVVLDNDYTGDYRYGGMQELFNLRREYRKLSTELRENKSDLRASFGKSRWGSSSNAEDLFNDIANDLGHDDCQRRIENLLKLLPITALREDLVNFFDEKLFQMQSFCEIMHGGVGRCVVEFVPYPIRPERGSDTRTQPVRGQHPPIAPNAFVVLAAAERMKSLINEEVPNLMRHHDGRLYGMSLFYQNRLVLSEVCGENQTLPPEIPYTIVEYFHNSAKKVKEEKHSDSTQQLNNSQNHTNQAPLGRWISNLSISAAKSEESEEGMSSNGNDNVEAANGSGYVAHPSRAKDTEMPKNSLFVRSMKKHVWIKRVYLPPTLGFDDESEIYVTIYESHELSFLLFFEVPSVEGEEDVLTQMAEELKPKSRKVSKISSSTQAFKDTLIFLADQLSDFCTTFSSSEAMKESTSSDNNMAPVKEINSDKIFPGEPGMDIICIDRDESSFVLLSQHDLSSNEFKRITQEKSDTATSPNGSKQKFGFFGGAKAKDPREQELSSCRPSQHSNMLDCRHKLAAYLPMDVLLAFDDMFNEFGCASCGRNDIVNVSTEGASATPPSIVYTAKSMELCTFLPQGWVYGRAFGNVELYILLDTSKFVTINDVQKAVTRVRERLFNDKIR